MGSRGEESEREIWRIGGDKGRMEERGVAENGWWQEYQTYYQTEC